VPEGTPTTSGDAPPPPGGVAGAPSRAGAGAAGASSPEVDASLYLHPQTLARLGSFELRARAIVEGVSSGMHRSPYQGFSVEFAQHRPYAPGDDLRHLDWKVYGRSDKLHLKQYQQETTLDVVILVDSSGSMNYGSRSFAEASGTGRSTSLDGRSDWTKYDHATALAAAVAYIALRQGDRAGLTIYADTVRASVRRASAQAQWRQVVSALSTLPLAPEEAGRPTALGRAVDQVLATLGNRCLLVIISDFFADVEQTRAALARARHRGHDAVCFQVTDRAERTFPFTDTAPFEGLEGEPRLRVDPRAIRAGYLEALARHQQALEAAVRSSGYDLQPVDSHDWLGPPLAAYLARRNAQIKRSKYG
jgi:uncharacterized protein (DUF58 family)